MRKHTEADSDRSLSTSYNHIITTIITIINMTVYNCIIQSLPQFTSLSSYNITTAVNQCIALFTATMHLLQHSPNQNNIVQKALLLLLLLWQKNNYYH